MISMKVTFQLTNKELKVATLLTYNKKKSYIFIKIFLSLFLSFLLSSTFIISSKLFFLTIAVHFITQSFSIRLILFLFLVFILFILIYSLFYYLVLDTLSKIMIHMFYLFKSNQSIQTTVMIEKEAFTYLNKLHRFMIPWTEIINVSEYDNIYLLTVSYLRKPLPLVKKPDTLSQEKRNQFHRALQPYISK